MNHIIVCDGQFCEVLGKCMLVSIHLSSFGIPAKEMKWQGLAKIEAQGPQHKTLHGTDVFLAVGIVCDVDEVVDFWGIHFLVLGSY